MFSLILTCAGGVLIFLAAALAVYLAIPFRYPFRTESDFTYASSPWWQLNYAHKYLRPRPCPEKGSGLGEYFSGLSFDFTPPTLEDERTISIRAVGDLMMRGDQLGVGGEHLWDEIGEYVFSGDLATGNLEFSVNDAVSIERLTRYAAPPSYAIPLLGDERYGSFGYLGLGNNHINDSLFAGIVSTRDFVESRGMACSGANRSREEQDEIPILEVKGVKVALLAYSFSTNGIPQEEGREWGVNIVRFNALDDRDYDPSLILRHIELARERGADYIVSNHHFGRDMELYPTRQLVERVHGLFEAGLDLVLGHHPHVINPVDRYRTRDGRECLAFYSLSSLTTYALPFAFQRLSEIAGIDLACGTDESGSLVVTPRRVELMPVYHSKNRVDGALINRVLRLNAGREAIAAGTPPPHYSRRDIRHLRALSRLYSRHFVQQGIRYL